MKHLRANLILTFIFVFAATIIGRLVVLQIIDHDLYAAWAQGQQTTLVASQGDRGKIFLQNHDLPVATTKVFVFAYLSPKEIPLEERAETAKIVSEVLNLDEASLMEKAGKDNGVQNMVILNLYMEFIFQMKKKVMLLH